MTPLNPNITETFAVSLLLTDNTLCSHSKPTGGEAMSSLVHIVTDSVVIRGMYASEGGSELPEAGQTLCLQCKDTEAAKYEFKRSTIELFQAMDAPVPMLQAVAAMFECVQGHAHLNITMLITYKTDQYFWNVGEIAPNPSIH